MTRSRFIAPLLFLVAAQIELASTADAQTFDLSWHTIDCGGATSPAGSTGGGYEMSGTIGQPDAALSSMPMSGGGYEVVGGFTAVSAGPSPACPGESADANCDGAVDFFDIDPFLQALFDNPQYLATYCNSSACAADVDASGTVDFFDIDPFLACLFGACP